MLLVLIRRTWRRWLGIRWRRRRGITRMRSAGATTGSGASSDDGLCRRTTGVSQHTLLLTRGSFVGHSGQMRRAYRETVGIGWKPLENRWFSRLGESGARAADSSRFRGSPQDLWVIRGSFWVAAVSGSELERRDATMRSET